MKFRDVFEERFVTLSNGLTVLRIFLLPPFFYYCAHYAADPRDDLSFGIVLAIILITVVTDFLDGFLARLLHQETMLGRYLDPISDKLVSLGSLLCLELYFDFPLAVLILYVLREIGGVWMGSYLYFKRDMMGRPNIWGKLGVTLTAVVVLWYVVEPRLRLVLPEGHVLLMPAIAAWLLVAVLLIGVFAYWRTYLRVIVYGEKSAPTGGGPETP